MVKYWLGGALGIAVRKLITYIGLPRLLELKRSLEKVICGLTRGRNLSSCPTTFSK